MRRGRVQVGESRAQVELRSCQGPGEPKLQSELCLSPQSRSAEGQELRGPLPLGSGWEGGASQGAMLTGLCTCVSEPVDGDAQARGKEHAHCVPSLLERWSADLHIQAYMALCAHACLEVWNVCFCVGARHGLGCLCGSQQQPWA